MRLPIYQIDAFAGKIFAGNPAAVCPLDEWLEDSVMQAIAQENNLSETAFFVPTRDGYHIRWFTPVAEVDLCGHATLGSAFVIFDILGHSHDKIVFHSLSGELVVTKNENLLTMEFPAQPPEVCEAPEPLLEGLGKAPLEVLASEDYMAVYESENDIVQLNPEMEKLRQIALRGVIVTAMGDTVDFVCRFFAPKYGINEDPVTGSAFCELMPYWSLKLGKDSLNARQLSRRGGEVYCRIKGNRVFISGKAVKFMGGEISI